MYKTKGLFSNNNQSTKAEYPLQEEITSTGANALDTVWIERNIVGLSKEIKLNQSGQYLIVFYNQVSI